ncbi:MAG: DnaA family protein [Oleiphilaceae bacterium]|jgi:DnaA family protein
MYSKLNRTSPNEQLALPVLQRHDSSFENFLGDANRKCVTLLKQSLEEHNETLIYIAGPSGSGKTHLMYAAISYFEARHEGLACYFSMDELVGNDDVDTLFEGLDSFSLVVLENIDSWLTSNDREQSLFNLFNHFKMTGQQLLLSSKSVPEHLSVALPDLSSRLKSGLLLTLVSLIDQEKESLLRDLAIQKGLRLEEEVSSYIIKRSGRNLSELVDVLDTLDQASLVEKRKLTVPFVKKILQW